MKKADYLGIFFAALMTLSIFLPWVEASSSASMGDYSSSFTTGAISGISFPSGIIALILSIIGCVLSYYSTPQNSDHWLSLPKDVTLSVDYESKKKKIYCSI